MLADALALGRELKLQKLQSLPFERKVFEQISEIAIEYKTGARSLRGIFEELIAPILFTVPDNPAIRKVGITSLFSDPAYVMADEVAARS